MRTDLHIVCTLMVASSACSLPSGVIVVGDTAMQFNDATQTDSVSSAHDGGLDAISNDVQISMTDGSDHVTETSTQTDVIIPPDAVIVDSCADGTSTCASGCVDTQTDPNNCGGCGHICQPPNNARGTCHDGVCSFQCVSGFHSCGSDCADSTSPSSCGSSCSQCPAPPVGGTATCDGTNCGSVCPGAETACSGVCTNLQSDNLHCGTCGNACSTGSTCCAGTCVNLMSSGTNCGACGTTCGANSNNCSSGQCRCSTFVCNGICVPRYDDSNCGTCGTVCTGTYHCSSFVVGGTYYYNCQ